MSYNIYNQSSEMDARDIEDFFNLIGGEKVDGHAEELFVQLITAVQGDSNYLQRIFRNEDLSGNGSFAMYQAMNIVK